MPLSREDYLAQSKKYALSVLESGDVREAFTSMLSDLSKHPELKDHVGYRIGVGLMMLPGWINDPVEVKRWIVGFN